MPEQAMTEHYASVRRFYDTHGWQRGPSGNYRDAEDFVDLRAVMRGYCRRRDRRVARLLARTEGTLLDIGCGAAPIPDPSPGLRRVCMDVSGVALRGARAVLGEGSAYLQGDVTRLPFASDAVSRVQCAHVLYHLHPLRQVRALKEIYRVLAPGGVAAVVYCRASSPLMRLTQKRQERLGRNTYAADGTVADAPPLPFMPVDCGELRRILADRMDLDVRTWAVLEPGVTKVVIPDNMFGSAVLLLASWAESMLPHRLLPLARYPRIIIRKSAARERVGGHAAVESRRKQSPAGSNRPTDQVRH
jgi:SAM-dependent methyltransferase